jgi:8-oxo-dGTP diphosphatase
MKTLHVVAAVIVKGDMVFATQRGYGPYKDGWEFPGGKIEEGETPEEALKREIREELDTEINVGKKLVEVVYDYPEIHLIMECYLCTVASGKLTLKEHEAARWLTPNELDTVKWLEADKKTVEALKRFHKDAERFEFKTVELNSPEFQ